MDRTDTVPELNEDALYEECPDCPPDGFCITCWDECLIPHGCTAQDAVDTSDLYIA